jgi:hypothetical protein
MPPQPPLIAVPSLREGKAPFAGWEQQARQGYLRSRLNVVSQEYTRVQGELIALNPNPEVSNCRRALGNLEDARAALQNSDAQSAAGAIAQADQALVWLSGDAKLEARAQQLIDELKSQGLFVAAHRLDVACGAPSKNDPGQGNNFWSDSHWRKVAAAVAEAIGELAVSQQKEWINNDLQVARLRLLAVYVGAALLLTLTATTIVANPHPVLGWPVDFLATLPTPFSSFLASAGVAVLGAAGGLFSGLLATQGATTSLLDYRTSVLRLILRPLAGALMACIIYIALSWQVVPGIKVTNGGTFLVLGFVTGFSERYILRVLNVPGISGSADSRDGEGGRAAENAGNRTNDEGEPTGGSGTVPSPGLARTTADRDIS